MPDFLSSPYRFFQKFLQKNSTKNPHKISILQILPALNSGGVERGTLEIASALQESGYRAIVASAGGRMTDELAQYGATHITLKLNSKNPLIILLNAFFLIKLIHTENISLLHARSRAPAWSALIAARLTNTPLITTFHGVYGHKTKLKRLYNSVMIKGEIVIAISNYIANHLQEIYDLSFTDIRVIPRGAETGIFSPIAVSDERKKKVIERFKLPKTHAKIILLPARITRWKGHLFALEALRSLHETAWHCICIGDVTKDSPYFEELQTKIRSYGLSERFSILPYEQDMPAAYAVSHIVLVPSLEPEAFGRVSVEAQAMERLVIATQHGGAAETILAGATGWLVEPGNIEQLRFAIAHGLDLSERAYQIIGKNARKHIISNYTKYQMCERTLAAYKEVLENHNRSNA
jgi:glycosyltransferase involved in cell wall biosynthesis